MLIKSIVSPLRYRKRYWTRARAAQLRGGACGFSRTGKPGGLFYPAAHPGRLTHNPERRLRWF